MRPVTVGALSAGLVVAFLVLAAKTIDRGQQRITGDVAVELPSDAIWPPPRELRSQLSTATDGQGSASDPSQIARRYIDGRLRSVSATDNSVVLGAVEPVVEEIVKISYQGNGTVYPGSLYLRHLGSTWYGFASENDVLHPFELWRDGRDIEGNFVPTGDGTARLRIYEHGGNDEPLVDREIEVVARRLIPFEARTRSQSPVVVSVTLSLADGRTALTELTL